MAHSVPTHSLHISEDNGHAVIVLDLDVPHTLSIVRVPPRIERAGEAS